MREMRSLRRTVPFVCIALLLSSCVTRARFDEMEAQHQAAQAEIVRLQGERDAVEERLVALEQAHDRLEGRAEMMEEMISTLRDMSACIRRLQIEVEGQPRPH